MASDYGTPQIIEPIPGMHYFQNESSGYANNMVSLPNESQAVVGNYGIPPAMVKPIPGMPSFEMNQVDLLITCSASLMSRKQWLASIKLLPQWLNQFLLCLLFEMNQVDLLIIWSTSLMSRKQWLAIMELLLR